MDAVRQAAHDQQIELIKEKVYPDYQRDESPGVPDLEVQATAGFLGVDKPSEADKEKLAFIRHQFDTETEADYLYQLRQVERMLGQARLGERRLDRVYNYLRAKQVAAQATKYRDSFLDGESQSE